MRAVRGSYCKVPIIVKHTLFSSDFNESLIFFTDFRTVLKYEISWKSAQWETSYFMRTDGRRGRRTDMTRLIVTLRYFENGPKSDYTQNTELFSLYMFPIQLWFHDGQNVVTYRGIHYRFFRPFLKIATISFDMSVRLSIWLPLEGFSYNLIF